MLGKSLDTLIHKNRKRYDDDYELHTSVTFDKKIELLMDVVRGMLYLHGLQPVIIHRDLKPSVSILQYSNDEEHFIG